MDKFISWQQNNKNAIQMYAIIYHDTSIELNEKITPLWLVP